MASSDGNPEQIHDGDTRNAETEPLLGGPGDAAQAPGAPLIKNLWIGTGWIAEVGVILLFVLVWVAIFLNPLLPLFSPHPLLQSFGVLTLTQAILVLQPTRTGTAKTYGARVHVALNLVSFLSFTAGVCVIEANKVTSHGVHFHSVHGYLGVITAVVLLLQYLFGFLMWATPAVLGGEARAKSMWKYHRMSGYIVLPLILATVISATKTSYNETVLGIKLWSVVVAAVLILIGVYPRISVAKLGLRRSQ